MFVGHYRCVNSPEEFFSEKKESLDFPTQVEVESKRYMLMRTYQFASESRYQELKDMAQKNNIKFGVKID